MIQVEFLPVVHCAQELIIAGKAGFNHLKRVPFPFFIEAIIALDNDIVTGVVIRNAYAKEFL
ncbi:MAG: hypothetical protein ACOH2B_12695 [Burkholderiaceae bacterium]